MSGFDLSSATLNAHHLHRPDSPHQRQTDSSDSLERIASPHRRPRGRPPGAKNKPKAPVIITRDTATTLRSHILEVGNGCDILDCLATYARLRQFGICIMSGTGMVTNVSLRQPGNDGEIVTLHGRYEILSLSGSFLPPPAPEGYSSLAIFLAGRGGQVVGGSVVGALIAAGPVIVMAGSFTNVAYERLPLEEDAGLEKPMPVSRNSGEGVGGGGGDGGVVINKPLQLFNLQHNMGNEQLLSADEWGSNGGCHLSY